MNRIVREIAVVGAGIGGLSTAIALAQRGHRVKVFERASELRAGGGALILWCNALNALERIGVREALMDAASTQPVEHSEFRRESGEYLTSMPVGEISRKYGSNTVLLARSDLLKTLYARAKNVSEIAFGVSVASVHEGAQGLDLALSDGTAARFDALIGADGLHSTLRAQLGLERPLRDLHQSLWVATTSFRPPGMEPGHTIATLGVGHRFWHALLGDGRTFWYATLRDGEGARRPDSLDALAAVYDGWHAPIAALIRATREADLVRTPMRDRAPSPEWGRGAITLLGDAAHAMTPDLGQGACQAIESAAVLAECLDGADVTRCLRDYEQRRFRRTSDVNRMSFLVATTSSVASPAMGRVRDAAMCVGLRATVVSQLDWLFRGPW